MDDMDSGVLINHIQSIIKDSKRLKDQFTDQLDAPVNYVCLFSHTDQEYDDLLVLAKTIGEVVQDTSTGPIFKIAPLPTSAGTVQLLKIRKPDKSRPERGDADFTVSDYKKFKTVYLGKPGFKLIERPDFEMIELSDPTTDVLAYFSHPTQEQLMGLETLDQVK
jgi:hypothetical protein